MHKVESSKREFSNAFDNKDLQKIRQCISDDPNLLHWRKFNQVSTLRLAISTNDYDIVKFILDSGLRTFTDFYNKCIQICARIGNVEIFKLLVEYGADPLEFEGDANTDVKARDSSGKVYNLNMNSRSPLILHASFSRNIGMIKHVLDLGIDINNFSMNGSRREDALVYLLNNCYSEDDNLLNCVKFLTNNGFIVGNDHEEIIVKNKLIGIYNILELTCFHKVTDIKMFSKIQNLPSCYYSGENSRETSFSYFKPIHLLLYNKNWEHALFLMESQNIKCDDKIMKIIVFSNDCEFFDLIIEKYNILFQYNLDFY